MMHPQAFSFVVIIYLCMYVLFCKNADNGSAQILKVIDDTIVVVLFQLLGQVWHGSTPLM